MTDFTIPLNHVGNRVAIITDIRRYFMERFRTSEAAPVSVDIFLTSLTKCYLHIRIPNFKPNANGRIEFEEEIIHDTLDIVPSKTGCCGVV